MPEKAFSVCIKDSVFIDPCMGSGHILVYAFDVLMQIYTSAGWDQREAAQSILKNNLFGLDIDDRAAQLAYFAVMMKARQYDRRLLTRGIQPNIFSIRESNGINRNQLKFFGWSMSEIERNTALTQLEYLLDTFRDAKEYGSILNVDMLDWGLLYRFVGTVDYSEQISMDELNLEGTKDALWNLVELGAVLAQKYDVVVTNPPYMGSSGMNAQLAQYVKEHFPETKADLFACFIERGNQMAVKHGFNCMVTMQSWMFLSSFEKMREKVLQAATITNLMHMENMVMGIAFGTAVTIFRNDHVTGYKGTYNQIKLQDIENGEPKTFPVPENRFAQTSTDNFSKIPGSPVAYWVSDTFILTFANSPIDNYAFGRQGMTTTDNLKYLRRWQEVSIKNIGFNVHSREESVLRRTTWFPYNKGGQYRKWFGNNEYVVFYYNDGKELIDLVTKKYPRISDPEFIIKNRNCYFKEGIEWSDLTTGNFGARRVMGGFIFDACSPTLFITGQCSYNYLLGMMNTVVFQKYMNILSPTMHYNICNVAQVPLLKVHESKVEETVHECIAESQDDWNSYETSWDFKRNPLV